MLTRLQLENCQCWKYLDISFSDKITTIVSPSNYGKSVIVRALEACLLNDINWNEFRTHKSGKTSISADIDDKQIIRTKTNALNTYEILDLKGIEAPQKKSVVKTDVPEDVQLITNISEYNIQKQKEQYFLVNLPSGQVAKHLNDVVGLSEVDTMLKKINSEIKKEEQTEQSLYAKCKKTEESILAIEWVDTALLDVQKIEQLEFQLKEIDILGTQLDQTIDDIDALESTLSLYYPAETSITINSILLQVSSVIEKENKVNAIVNLMKDISFYYNEIKQIIPVTVKQCIKGIIKEIENASVISTKVTDIEDSIRQLLFIIKQQKELKEQVDTALFYAETDSLLNLLEEYNKKEDTAYVLSAVLKDCVDIYAQMTTTNKKRIQAEKEQKQLLTKYGMCPTCLRPVTECDDNK